MVKKAMEASAIKYNAQADRAFQEELFRAKKSYFAAEKSGPKANGKMWLKTAILIGAHLTLWTELALRQHSLGVTIAFILLLAGVSQSIGFTVAHDAVHGSYSRRKWVNDLLYYFSFNMFGTNAYLWKIRHNNAHHFCVNIPGADYDIEGTQVVRFAPHRPWLRFHRFQHLYASFGYMIYTLHWIFVKDFTIYFKKDFGAVTNLQHPRWRFLELIALKIVYVVCMVGIPYWSLGYPLWKVVAAFLGFHFVMSWSITMSFVSSHLSSATNFIKQGADGEMPFSFVVHQLYTSVDFHPLNPVVSFLFGGFNCHVAHHMFPEVNSIHLPALTRVIQDLCRKYELPYYEMALPKLFAQHFNFLRDMGSSGEGGKQKLIFAEA